MVNPFTTAIFNGIIHIMDEKKTMKYYGDYHTHTKYSDGLYHAEDNVKQAINKGFLELAITDHGFNSPSNWALTRTKFKKQREEIELLREKYQDKLTIYHGIEADIIGEDGTIDLEKDELKDIDVLLMGYHSFAKAKTKKDWWKLYFPSFLRIVKYPSKAVIARNTAAMIRSIKRYPIDVLVHPNHLFKIDCYEVAKAAADYGTYIELNRKHFNFTHDIFEDMLKTDVKFILNSDAHLIRDIGNFTEIENFLTKHTFDPKRIVNLENKPVFKKRT